MRRDHVFYNAVFIVALFGLVSIFSISRLAMADSEESQRTAAIPEQSQSDFNATAEDSEAAEINNDIASAADAQPDDEDAPIQQEDAAAQKQAADAIIPDSYYNPPAISFNGEDSVAAPLRESADSIPAPDTRQDEQMNKAHMGHHKSAHRKVAHHKVQSLPHKHKKPVKMAKHKTAHRTIAIHKPKHSKHKAVIAKERMQTKIHVASTKVKHSRKPASVAKYKTMYCTETLVR